MSKRHDAAISSLDQAMSLDELAEQVVSAQKEILSEGGSTKDVALDPAVRLLVRALSSACRVEELDSDMNTYANLVIQIESRENDLKKDAYAVQEGASNLGAIARTLLKHLKSWPEPAPVPAAKDPSIRLIVHQMKFLSGGYELNQENRRAELVSACRSKQAYERILDVVERSERDAEVSAGVLRHS
jgi:hypothetical protein